ncbi:MAG TPA: hypothetical protein VEB21_03055, partial [Terriglobales bacterium]|nr:hypothetical protein [Terriglobales bacterium]
ESARISVGGKLELRAGPVRGDRVDVEVRLEPEEEYIGFVMDVLYPSDTVSLDEHSCILDAAIANDRPECRTAPPMEPCKRLEAEIVNCGSEPEAGGCEGVPPADDRLRAIVWSPDDRLPLPAGRIFHCTFTVIDAERLPALLDISGVAGEGIGHRVGPLSTHDTTIEPAAETTAVTDESGCAVQQRGSRKGVIAGLMLLVVARLCRRGRQT